MPARARRVVAVAAILLLSGINYFGVRAGGAVQTALTAIKVAAVVGLALLLLASPAAAPAGGPTVPVTTSGMLLAIGAGLFAFATA